MKVFFDETQKERGKINTNYSILRDALRSEGFVVEAYNDFPISEKALKCDVFVFACPDGSKLTKGEVEAITTFVERGGGLLVISNAGGDRGLRTNMNEILNKFGIDILSDQVKDEANNEFNMPTHPVIKDIKAHPITNGVSELVIVAGSSVRGSAQMKGVAYTSPVAEPSSAPVVIAGEHKSGRVVALGSYRLFSNYGAGLTLRNNKTLALNIFRWLSGKDVKKAASVAATTTTRKPSTIAKPTVSRTSTQPKPKTAAKVTTQTATSTKPVTRREPSVATGGSVDSSITQEIESLRSDISEMREIVARLYADSLGYLQEMQEEVRAMLDYLRNLEGKR